MESHAALAVNGAQHITSLFHVVLLADIDSLILPFFYCNPRSRSIISFYNSTLAINPLTTSYEHHPTKMAPSLFQSFEAAWDNFTDDVALTVTTLLFAMVPSAIYDFAFYAAPFPGPGMTLSVTSWFIQTTIALLIFALTDRTYLRSLRLGANVGPVFWVVIYMVSLLGTTSFPEMADWIKATAWEALERSRSKMV
ncbi:hypothetical protein LTR27_003586 [Elasticomyces elasticus]|nr:hypothetical protein LTR27_003586 [Elasticomyces elasticus]